MMKYSVLLIFFFCGSVSATYYNLGPFYKNAAYVDPCSLPSPPVGATCSNGVVTAGTGPTTGPYAGKVYMITPANCVFGTSTCTGGTDSSTMKWSGSSSDVGLIAAVEYITTTDPSTHDGWDDTIQIKTYFAGLGTTDTAAHFCRSLTYAGYNDWYLPSKSELTYIWCHSANNVSRTGSKPASDPNCANSGTTGLTLPGFSTGTYLTATQGSSSSNVWALDGSGNEVSKSRTFLGYVRCIRHN